MMIYFDIFQEFLCGNILLTVAVEVVKEKNQNDDNVEEMEDVNTEPEWGTGIVQVMEYMKSHGDYLFMESTEQGMLA